MKITKKILCPLMCTVIGLCTIISSFAEDAVVIAETEERSASAYYDKEALNDPLSPGIRVMAYDNPMVVSSIKGESFQFSSEVFDSYNGYVPSSVKIISLPDTNAGTLIYNSEPVAEGQSISVLSLNSLYYEPNTDTEPSSNTEAEFTFSSDNTNVMRCVLRQKYIKNSSPSTTDNSSVTTYTRLDTSVGGYLGGMDVDGDSVTYEIVSGPAKGIVSVVDKGTGQFVYHPYEGMHGSDSFTYRLRDYYGSYSDIGKVNISIARSKATVYNDMSDSYYTAAANDVVESGIMQISKTEDGDFFNPNEPVSKIDFLIMAMKTMGAGEAQPVSSTSFTDDSTLSDTEKGYLSAAYRLGIIKGETVNGKLVFNPDEAITGASAAVILNGILGLHVDESQQAIALGYDIPVWAIPSFSALHDSGIIEPKTAPCYSKLSRENVAVILSGLMHKLV